MTIGDDGIASICMDKPHIGDPCKRCGHVDEKVGRAFRCADGLIRWITHLSTRNYYSVLWRREDEDTWHGGGIYKVNKWEGGEEVPAPQPGESYRIVGATGVVSEQRINSMNRRD